MRPRDIDPTDVPDAYAAAMQRIDDRFFRGGWRYNQIVGWIQVLVFGRQVRGEYWQVDAQRIHWRTSDKRFEWMGKAFEFHVDPGQTSAAILTELREHLTIANRVGAFARRYVDLEAFDNVAPFIDWRALVEA